MHDLNCADAKDMYSEVLAKRVYELRGRACEKKYAGERNSGYYEGECESRSEMAGESINLKKERKTCCRNAEIPTFIHEMIC